MDNEALVEIETLKSANKIIVNGQPFNQEVSFKRAFCSNCNRVIAQFEPGAPFKHVIGTLKENVSQDIIYCPTCGCKLIYLDIIEGNIE